MKMCQIALTAGSPLSTPEPAGELTTLPRRQLYLRGGKGRKRQGGGKVTGPEVVANVEAIKIWLLANALPRGLHYAVI